MKKWIAVFTLLGLIIATIFAGINYLPGYLYGKLIKNQLTNNWYKIDQFSPVFLTPSDYIPLKKVKIENEFLWRRFNFGDLSLQLPIKNPFYFVIPKVDIVNGKTNLSLKITNPRNDTLVEVNILNKFVFDESINSQRLFELPLVSKVILKRNSDEIWSDLFSKKIPLVYGDLNEMFYSLYLIHLRSRYIPTSTLEFGHLENQNKVSIQLDPIDKDYHFEIVQTKRGKEIYSLLIKTKIEDQDAAKLRYKIINDIQFQASSKALVDIIIKEFKGLKYKDQVDHLGMLYLLSAWSYDLENQGILKNLIFYLERGVDNQNQLAPLYEYYYQKYGEVYSKRDIKGLDISLEALLKRNISLEEERRKKEDLKIQKLPPKKIEKRNLSKEFDDMIDSVDAKKRKNMISID